MLVIMDEPFLKQIKTGWLYRRRVPDELIQAAGKREFKKKLGGIEMEPHQAVRLARA